jgi:hypothetical protein
MIALVEVLRARHPGIEHVMLACDTLAAATPGAELSGSAHMTAALSRLQRVRDHFGAHLAIVTHTPKDNPTVARDSGALIGHVDVAYNIHEKKITMTHINRGTIAAPMPFTFEGVKMGVDEDGADYEVLFTEVREAPGGGEGAPAFADKRSKKQREADAETSRFENMILDTMRGLGAAKEKIRHKALTDAIKATGEFDLDDKGRISAADRKRLHTSKRALMGRELGMTDTFVWSSTHEKQPQKIWNAGSVWNAAWNAVSEPIEI